MLFAKVMSTLFKTTLKQAIAGKFLQMDVSTNATCYLPHRAVINPRKPVSSEISDLLILLFVSYFASQSKE